MSRTTPINSSTREIPTDTLKMLVERGIANIEMFRTAVVALHQTQFIEWYNRKRQSKWAPWRAKHPPLTTREELPAFFATKRGRGWLAESDDAGFRYNMLLKGTCKHLDEPYTRLHHLLRLTMINSGGSVVQLTAADAALLDRSTNYNSETHEFKRPAWEG